MILNNEMLIRQPVVISDVRRATGGHKELLTLVKKVPMICLVKPYYNLQNKKNVRFVDEYY
jgi:hypothetical protein